MSIATVEAMQVAAAKTCLKRTILTIELKKTYSQAGHPEL
jgi:hypothetical protein